MTVIRTSHLHAYLLAASALLGLQSTAYADDTVKPQATPLATQASVSTSTRLSLPELIAKLERAGYSHISEIELDDGHYEVEARNPQGQRVELDVHTVNGQVLRTQLDN